MLTRWRAKRPAPGNATLVPIRARFGPAVFGPDGTLDRAALAEVVFSDPAALGDLEAMVHPRVRELVEAALDEAAVSGAPFAVVEAIKLVEGGLAERCDEVWLIDCPADVQRSRMIDRGMVAEDIDRRLAAQGGLRERIVSGVTRTLDTSGTLDETRDLVEDALAEALAGSVDILPFGSVER